MMKIALKDEMKEIDRRAAEEFAVDEIMLMENAGAAVAFETNALLNGVNGKTVAIVAGTGNNGGDAFVCARHLLNYGARCKVFLAGDRERLTESAAKNLSILEAMDQEVGELFEERTIDRFKMYLSRFADCVIDGLLGTGFHGEMRENIAEVIDIINKAGKKVVAIDIPSGVEADTGAAEVAIKADVTVSLGSLKFGHFFSPGKDLSGKIKNHAIGLPVNLLNEGKLTAELIEYDLVKNILRQRSSGVYKGSVGRVAVLAGSNGMTGAAILSSRASLRVGAGLSTLMLPKSLQGQVEPLTLEVMTLGLPECEAGFVGGEEALKPIINLANKSDVLLMGPGLGRNAGTMQLVRDVAANANTQLVLDADAIFAFKQYKEQLLNTKKIAILTPHLGELALFLNMKIDELKKDLIRRVKETATVYRSIFVVKSECTLIAYPTGEIYAENSGNTGMATAGAGDVLAGTIAGLFKETGDKASILGVHLHTIAGNMAYEVHGEGLMARDILENLGTARKRLSS
ncbi:MAG: NAD(P)H-hydrate dehydratase [Selenomonadaceae bacterium]|nr:NAD(P)H-hydrate dehydratase [Selenomonadaceae bacterium]